MGNTGAGPGSPWDGLTMSFCPPLSGSALPCPNEHVHERQTNGSWTAPWRPETSWSPAASCPPGGQYESRPSASVFRCPGEGVDPEKLPFPWEVFQRSAFLVVPLNMPTGLPRATPGEGLPAFIRCALYWGLKQICSDSKRDSGTRREGWKGHVATRGSASGQGRGCRDPCG